MLFESDRLESKLFSVEDSRSVHLQKILKVKPGDEIAIGLLNGGLGTGKIQSVSETGIRLEASFVSEVCSRPKTTLILAMPRPKVLRRILPELVALGLGRIVLLRSWRVEKSYLESDVIKPEVYRPLIHHGLMQGKYTCEPEFLFEPRFRPFVEDRLDALAGDSVRLFAHPDSPASMASVSLASTREVTLAIGPEGGWVDYEIEAFENQGFQRIRLGERILKVETACAVLMGQLELLRAQFYKNASS